MINHPNAELINQVYDAFTHGDLEAASKYWTDDCVHHYPGHGPLSGSHQRMRFVDVSRIEDGKVAEFWDVPR